ncbi:hypothetical protein SLS60_001879 [Paraconiothyrium brasiliense]|uniref:Transcription factor domain-containing protein n=1 Tax=Paraconiothyrium brasiliense TaxID=300254 RepID=A0ABR3S1L9_9PLEO
MVCWGRLAADVWDGFFAAATLRDGEADDNALVLDARIRHWTDVVFPTIPLLPPEYPPEARQLRQNTIVLNSLDQLRLLLFRQAMLGLRCDLDFVAVCKDLANNIVSRTKAHSGDVNLPICFRFSMASSLSSAILVLATILLRNFQYLGADVEEAYREATNLLANLASGLALARRMRSDFSGVDNLIQEAAVSTELNFDHVLSADTRELFPYTSVDFTQQSGFSADADLGNAHANGSGSVSSLNTDLWSTVSAGKEGKYGVPWI